MQIGKKNEPEVFHKQKKVLCVKMLTPKLLVCELSL